MKDGKKIFFIVLAVGMMFLSTIFGYVGGLRGELTIRFQGTIPYYVMGAITFLIVSGFFWHATIETFRRKPDNPN